MNQSEWWFRISVDAQSAATLRYSSAKSRQRSARYSGSDMIPPKTRRCPTPRRSGRGSRWCGRNEESLSDKFLFPGPPIKRLRVIPGLRSHVREWFLGSCHMLASERSGSSTIETPGEISKRRRRPEGARRLIERRASSRPARSPMSGSRPRNRPPPPFGAGQLPSDRWANDDPSLPQTARSRPHRMAGIRSIGETTTAPARVAPEREDGLPEPPRGAGGNGPGSLA